MKRFVFLAALAAVAQGGQQSLLAAFLKAHVLLKLAQKGLHLASGKILPVHGGEHGGEIRPAGTAQAPDGRRVLLDVHYQAQLGVKLAHPLHIGRQ